MIVAAAGVVELTDRAIELSLRLVLQVEHAPLVGVAGRGAGPEHRGVELGRAPQVERAVDRRQPVPERALHADVPLLQLGRLEMERRVDVDAERRERRRLPAGVECRERVATRIAEIWIGEAARRIRDRDLRTPRRVVREARVEE